MLAMHSSSSSRQHPRGLSQSESSSLPSHAGSASSDPSRHGYLSPSPASSSSSSPVLSLTSKRTTGRWSVESESSLSESSTSILGLVGYWFKDGVCVLTLNNPRLRNALSYAVLSELHDKLERVAEDERVRVCILASVGPVFSSGHDLLELHRMTHDQHVELFSLCSNVMMLIHSLPQPVIAMVQGVATAAGCQLAAACDLVVASSEATFSVPGAKTIGLFCSTPGVELSRSIPVKHAMELLLTGRNMDAQEAKIAGLVNIISSPKTLKTDTLRLARQISKVSGEAVSVGKRAFYAQLKYGMNVGPAYKVSENAMVKNLQLPDADEGIQSFLEKREPSWKHERDEVEFSVGASKWPPAAAKPNSDPGHDHTNGGNVNVNGIPDMNHVGVAVHTAPNIRDKHDALHINTKNRSVQINSHSVSAHQQSHLTAKL